jgi:hypothetical protein
VAQLLEGNRVKLLHDRRMPGSRNANIDHVAVGPGAAELLSQASRLMTQAYENMLAKMHTAGVALYSDALNNATAMWLECEGEWGQGWGYRQRVADHNREWFAAPAILALENDLRNSLIREWDSVLTRVGSIFDVE